jgi:hypothetical protein
VLYPDSVSKQQVGQSRGDQADAHGPALSLETQVVVVSEQPQPVPHAGKLSGHQLPFMIDARPPTAAREGTGRCAPVPRLIAMEETARRPIAAI